MRKKKTVCIVPAVVTELDDIVLVAMALGAHNETEQSLLLLLSINDHTPTKEPVATVFTGDTREEHGTCWKTLHGNVENFFHSLVS